MQAQSAQNVYMIFRDCCRWYNEAACVPELTVQFGSQRRAVLIVSVFQLGLASERKVADPKLFYTSAAGDRMNRWGKTDSNLQRTVHVI